ncbi:MAG: alpha/beta hydrolase [Novosphingobium sp.]
MAKWTRQAWIVGIALAAPGAGLAEEPAAPAQARPAFDADGTVRVPAFDLPASAFLSPEALEAQKRRARAPVSTPGNNLPIAAVRKGLAAMLAPQIAGMQAQYPVEVTEGDVAGVPVRTFVPKGKPWDKKRVLINLHGGGFSMCWESCSMLESIPISVIGGYKVVSVNYRMGPEAKHPAALEDVEKVYRQLLKTYKAKNIGIYGCSAGGALTGQTAAWLPRRGLPQPGGIGIFGAGAVRFMSGDSAYISGNISGAFPPPPKDPATAGDMTRGYFDGADYGDAVISAALHPDVIAKFPPALIITGTRAMDLSPAVVTNSSLLKAGVKSTLVVGEGMDHCYIYQSTLPEARDAYGIIVRHFRETLK